MKIFFITLCIAANLLVLGCANPMPKATSSSVGADQVIIVGKFELVPPVHPDHEQTTHLTAPDSYIINSVTMLTADDARSIDPDNIKISDFDNSITAKWGEYFYMLAPRKKIHIVGGIMYLDVVSNDKVWFPGGFIFESAPDSSAVYVGTIRYLRGDFWTFKSIEILNEFDEAKSAFYERFDRTLDLKESLFQDVNAQKGLLAFYEGE